MNTLNSVSKARTPAKIGIGMLAIAAVVLIFSVSFFAFAAGTTVSVNASAVYNNSVTIGGVVSPAPGSGSQASISVTNPSGTQVLTGVATVNPTTGVYNATFTPGGTGNWVNGTYTVTVTWASSPTATPVIGSGTFAYGTFTTPTTTPTTTSSGSGGATTTTIMATTTLVQQFTTTVNAQTTTTVAQQFTTTVNAQTTVTMAYTGSSDMTGTYVGAVGVVIAIIAGALAALALRKK